jgi:hypothetical protein
MKKNADADAENNLLKETQVLFSDLSVPRDFKWETKK